MQYFYILLLFSVISLNLCMAQDKWVWSKARKNIKVHSYYPDADKRVSYAEEQYARADREREPTTKRPLPGQPQNDDIDDYNDTNDELTKQNSPYLPNLGSPRFAGNTFNGFANYPSQIGGVGFPVGNAANGILVGPGGPTGIIGRPPPQYPAGVPASTFPNLGQGSYIGFGVAQNYPSGAGYPNYNGLNNGIGPYPGQPLAFPNTQQYPQAQYPSAQFPQQPQYTQGYGLGNFNLGHNGNPSYNANFNRNHGLGFDEYPAQLEGKSAQIKTTDKKVDDKLMKKL